MNIKEEDNMIMQKIDYLEAQSQLAKTMRKVCELDTPITINGAGKDQVVMMPLDTFNKLRTSLTKNSESNQFG
jgi:PHD/YefM family antitoxin component YafN of YafNO toxin-antitoxin module